MQRLQEFRQFFAVIPQGRFEFRGITACTTPGRSRLQFLDDEPRRDSV
jgi:hypothetical protein